jgi:hypothetical protein
MFCSLRLTELNFSVESVKIAVDLQKTNLLQNYFGDLPPLNASGLCLKMRVNEWLPQMVFHWGAVQHFRSGFAANLANGQVKHFGRPVCVLFRVWAF